MLGILIGLAFVDLSPIKPYPIASVSRSIWTSSHPPSAGRPLTNVKKPCEVNSKSHSASILTLDIRQAIPECFERESPLLVGARILSFKSYRRNIHYSPLSPFRTATCVLVPATILLYIDVTNPSLSPCCPSRPSTTGVFSAMIHLHPLFRR